MFAPHKYLYKNIFRQKDTLSLGHTPILPLKEVTPPPPPGPTTDSQICLQCGTKESTRQGERRGRGNALFLHCQDCGSLAVVVVAHFNSHLAGRHLTVIGRTNDWFCHLKLWFVVSILQTNLSLIPEVSRSLFVHSVHL